VIDDRRAGEWLKIVRAGRAVTGYQSGDGATRKAVGTAADSDGRVGVDRRLYDQRQMPRCSSHDRLAAYTADPISPASAFNITFTGISSSIVSSGGLSRKARMNAPVVSAGRIFGAMPPPM
jgi:hypothetical protein